MGGLEVIDQRYSELYERARETLGADPRVKSVELSGSVAAGTADRWSDLDLNVITEPDLHESFLSARADWIASITPTVFARTPIAPFIINTVTGEGLTLDFAVWSGQAPALPVEGRYAVGMLSSQRFDDVVDALEYAVEEQLRGLAGPFISLIQRDEHLRHLTGIPHVLGLLTTVFLAETNEPPPGKHWNRTFTEEQRSAVAVLPAIAGTRDSIMAFSFGVAELLTRRARPLYDRHGRTWPAEFATVSAGRIHSELGIDVSSWLY